MLKFLDDIELNLKKNCKVRICFGCTELLRPGGTLYFMANIQSLLDRYPDMIECSYPRNDVVEQLFQHIGLLQQLGKTSRKEVTAKNVVNWHFAFGNDATTSAFHSLLTQHQDAIGGEIVRSELYDCMSEAIINTRKHAYPKQRDAKMSRWWMFSQAFEGELTVAICDLGIGIPKSLLEKPYIRDYLNQIKYSLKPNKIHEILIEIAVNSNRSSTQLAYRGKGLPQMLDFIKQGTKGGFRVQSGYGLYIYSAKLQKSRSETKRHSIQGTLIEWTLPLISGVINHENS